jgi:hypothetical protein
MLGYDISWAAFNIIEVMSSTKFTYKVCKFILKLELDKLLNSSLSKIKAYWIFGSITKFS